MFTKVPSHIPFGEFESQVVEFWKTNQTFDKLRRKNSGGPRWSFLDGPITANNPIGIHHVWGRTYKDCYQRFFAMKGCELRYQNGFDCQGLSVALGVEKELGLKNKREIELYGVERFVKKCKERARLYAALQTKQSILLGYWMDWDNSYYTMSDENNYTVWQFLKTCHQRGLIHFRRDTMPWCPRCGIGFSHHDNFEEYKEVTANSAIVRMPLCGRAGEYLLVWAAAPWTLPANVACAINPKFTYVKVKQSNEIYYIAKQHLGQLAFRGPYEVQAEIRGEEIEGWAYQGPFDELSAAAPAVDAHRVLLWDLVTIDDGTGITHIAPGCGKEDYELGNKYNLPVIVPIDECGIYLDGYGYFAGMNAAGIEDEIFSILRKKGYFFKKTLYTQSWPHCCLCKTPLLFRNAAEWYLEMSWLDQVKNVAKQARWIPAWGLDYELDWLTNMHDWVISMNHYWGLALPIFRCGCGWFDVIGGKEELRERAIEGWEEFEGHSPHRPWVDVVKIKCKKCGTAISRIPEVGNPLLDAGIVPYSTLSYQHDRNFWAKWFPADFITECLPGQIYQWFYALLLMSTIMENTPPFKVVLGHGVVRDEAGDEMHKSGANSIPFDDVAERMGCDVIRWLFCRENPAKDLRFTWAIGDEIQLEVLGKLWNVYAFFCNCAQSDGFNPRTESVPLAERPVVDRRVLSDLQILVRTANECMTNFDVASFVRQAERFIDDLSNTYTCSNIQRFQRAVALADRDKLSAYHTLYEALVTLCTALAPIIPFLTEVMYQHLVSELDETAPCSVHLADYPKPKTEFISNEGYRR